MAKRRSLILSSKDSFGNEVKKSFTGVNNASSNADIDAVMRSLNGLTKNTYYDTYIVETESVSEAIAEEN